MVGVKLIYSREFFVMSKKPLFTGLVFDENDRSVEVAIIGLESFYVVDDVGFKRHIPSEEVDRQVLVFFQEQMKGHEDMIAEQTTKMMGQDDLFSRAIIQNQLKNMDKQFESLLETGFPEEGNSYLGLMGFKIVINIHGEISPDDES
jgi:hypothetical protein